MNNAVPLIRWAPYPHNGAQVSGGQGGLRLRTGPGQWSYAVALPLNREVLALAAGRVLMVEIHLRVIKGRIAAGFLTPDQTRYVSAEAEAGTGNDCPLLVELDPSQTVGSLMLRNSDPSGQESEAEITSIAAYALAAGWEDEAAPYLAAETMPLSQLSQVVGRFGRQPGNGGGDGSIDAVPVASLGERLGYNEPCPQAPVPPLHQWRMEDHDLPLLQYLFRQHQPQRHLEFGTWEGAGAVACAEACEAEIWTINLPEGERDESGRALYGGDTPSDAHDRIGWRYREAGYGPRVHQILADSRDPWDAGLPEGFFDSVLIDGGHAAGVVASDTAKALRLLRPGGLCLWHDFCPTPRVLLTCPAPRGVVRAVVDHWPHWRPLLRDAFWLRPSWVLVGVRA